MHSTAVHVLAARKLRLEWVWSMDSRYPDVPSRFIVEYTLASGGALSCNPIDENGEATPYRTSKDMQVVIPVGGGISSNTASSFGVEIDIEALAWCNPVHVAGVYAAAGQDKFSTLTLFSGLASSTAARCDSRHYLDTADADPTKWACSRCPDGAACDGAINLDGVRAKFGFYRSTFAPVTSSAASQPPRFLPCNVPLACLGSANIDLVGQYYRKDGTDLAKPSTIASTHPGTPVTELLLATLGETCNYEAGYQQWCLADGTELHKVNDGDVTWALRGKVRTHLLVWLGNGSSATANASSDDRSEVGPYFASLSTTEILAQMPTHLSDGTAVPLLVPCRSCATCREGYRRAAGGLAYRCNLCPANGPAAVILFAFLTVILVALLIAVVWVAMGDAGTDVASNALTKIFCNYLQAAALALNFSLEWPSSVRTVLNLQGTISTVGDFLVSPDCVLSHLRSADVFYGKSVFFLVMPFLLILGALFFWGVCAARLRLWDCLGDNVGAGTAAAAAHQARGCCVRLRAWRRQDDRKLRLSILAKGTAHRGSMAAVRRMSAAAPLDHGVDSHEEQEAQAVAELPRWLQSGRRSLHSAQNLPTPPPPPDLEDHFVLTCVILLYLSYPTLCRCTFRLFTCVESERADMWFLQADLQALCYAGDHLMAVLLLGVPSVLLYVVGLPMAAVVLMRANAGRREACHVQYRYGLLFSGFRSSSCAVELKREAALRTLKRDLAEAQRLSRVSLFVFSFLPVFPLFLFLFCVSRLISVGVVTR